MKDATMRQGNRLIELVLQADDPSTFAQNLIERWGAVRLIGEAKFSQAQLIDALQHIETRNPYPSTRTKSVSFVPRGYKSSSGKELAQRLQAVRPGINLQYLDQLLASYKVPEGADGVYAIPKVTYEANLLGIDRELVRANFDELVEEVCKVLATGREFIDNLETRLGSGKLDVVDKTWDALMKLEEQPGDVIVFPAQTGALFAGCRPDWVRFELEHDSTQWPLSSYEVGWMLVGNPNRLKRFDNLYIDCPGTRYRLNTRPQYEDSQFYGFDNIAGLSLNFRTIDSLYSNVGSGSGFLQ